MREIAIVTLSKVYGQRSYANSAPQVNALLVVIVGADLLSGNMENVLKVIRRFTGGMGNENCNN